MNDACDSQSITYTGVKKNLSRSVGISHIDRWPMKELRVLIIDDDQRACEILCHHLKQAAPAAFIHAPVNTVQTGRSRLLRRDYDVVFLDVHLQDGDGFDLVPFVSADSHLIFVTGHDDHAVRAFEVNASDYIVKP